MAGSHDQRSSAGTAVVLAGVPAVNKGLYHAVRFSVGDPAALVILPEGRVFIVRDIEAARARQAARADIVKVPADFAPSGGLSGDRETATAQAVAECVRRAGVQRAVVDRSLPYIYAAHLVGAGVVLEYDDQLAVRERRSKDEQEVAWLAQAQRDTEAAMELACTMIARAQVARDGTLVHEGGPLTAERVRTAADVFLLGRNYLNPAMIVAGGVQGGDCHHRGHGVLRTGEPVIVDIFPTSRDTGYSGDCTRTVVHGEPSDRVVRMHAAVIEAKAAAVAATRAGTTGQAVYEATMAVMRRQGYERGLPGVGGVAEDAVTMQHGTGHGIGLEVHEPPLLDVGGPELVVGDALTIEPGLYGMRVGGVRIEDMVIVREGGCESLNRLHEGLDWS